MQIRFTCSEENYFPRLVDGGSGGDSGRNGKGDDNVDFNFNFNNKDASIHAFNT